MKHNIKTLLVLIVIFLAIRCLLRVSKYSTDDTIKDVCKSPRSVCKDQTKKKGRCMRSIKRACDIFNTYATKPVARMPDRVMNNIQDTIRRARASTRKTQEV